MYSPSGGTTCTCADWHAGHRSGCVPRGTFFCSNRPSCYAFRSIAGNPVLSDAIGSTLARLTMRLRSWLWIAATLVGVAATAAQSQTQTGRLYLEALDERGAVEGLTPRDVAVFDGGTKREITRLVRAADPMRILLLVDNGRSAQPFIQEIRGGIVAFADAIPAEHELGLVTIGNTPVVRQEPSTDRTALKHIAKTLTTGGTTVLVNAVYEMYDRFLRNAGDRWPVLAIVTSDGSEGCG